LNGYCIAQNDLKFYDQRVSDAPNDNKHDILEYEEDNIIYDLGRVKFRSSDFPPNPPENNVYDHSSSGDSKNHSNLATQNNNDCSFCGKTFTRKDNLDRHLADRCKEKREKDNDKSTMQLLLSKISLMEKELLELRNDKNNQINIKNNINTNSNNVNNINNNQYDIKIIAFGEENLYERIGDEVAKKFIANGYQSVLQLIDYVHFNKDHPELQNVYISNKKNDVAQVFNGSYWEDRPKEDVVEQLFDDKQCFLLDIYKEVKHALAQAAQTKFERFKNETDAAIIAGLKKEIQLHLYNKGKEMIKTKKSMKSIKY
jgi:hypothetical protein